jgi:hypothetical protein
MASTAPTLPSTSAAPILFRPLALLTTLLTTKKAQLARAWDDVMAPRRDGILGGRRRDNCGPLLRQIRRFEKEKEGLEWEVFRVRAMEMWVEDQWGRVGVEGGWKEMERDRGVAGMCELVSWVEELVD